ncbi:MAG: hypothetical protein ABI597_00115 [Gammaproteobacteria bacterium]
MLRKSKLPPVTFKFSPPNTVFGSDSVIQLSNDELILKKLVDFASHPMIAGLPVLKMEFDLKDHLSKDDESKYLLEKLSQQLHLSASAKLSSKQIFHAQLNESRLSFSIKGKDSIIFPKMSIINGIIKNSFFKHKTTKDKLQQLIKVLAAPLASLINPNNRNMEKIVQQFSAPPYLGLLSSCIINCEYFSQSFKDSLKILNTQVRLLLLKKIAELDSITFLSKPEVAILPLINQIHNLMLENENIGDFVKQIKSLIVNQATLLLFQQYIPRLLGHMTSENTVGHESKEDNKAILPGSNLSILPQEAKRDNFEELKGIDPDSIDNQPVSLAGNRSTIFHNEKISIQNDDKPSNSTICQRLTSCVIF